MTRNFGIIEKLPSGRCRARYTAPDVRRYTAPVTFLTKKYPRGHYGKVTGFVDKAATFDPNVTPISQPAEAKDDGNSVSVGAVMRRSIVVASLMALLSTGCSHDPQKIIDTREARSSAVAAATPTAPTVRIDGRAYDAPLKEVECRNAFGSNWYWVWRPQGDNMAPGVLSVGIDNPADPARPLVVQFIGAPGWPTLVYPENAKWVELAGDSVEFTRTETGLTLSGRIYEDSDDQLVAEHGDVKQLPLHEFEAEVSCPDGWLTGPG